ncbi:MAG: hypothetical protein M5U34_36300 [Chloroflexi bacterium]|nr:hypothetical protein [Chloroflexota bacterium]
MCQLASWSAVFQTAKGGQAVRAPNVSTGVMERGLPDCKGRTGCPRSQCVSGQAVRAPSYEGVKHG